MYIQDECTIPGAFIGGVATAPCKETKFPESLNQETGIHLRQMLRTVKRKTQREMQQLASNLGLRLAWKIATRTKDLTKPVAIITPFGCVHPAPRIQEDILGLIVGEIDAEEQPSSPGEWC